MGCNFSSSDSSDGGRTVSDGRGDEQVVLFFPDESMPCRYGKDCRRGASCQYSHKQTSLTRFLAYLNKAKRTLDVCVFTITCNEIADAITDAHKRGVTVRIITDDDQSKTKGSDVESFARAGIEVRLDNSEKHMHHKFAIIDQRLLLTGSFNWTRQAVLGNRENVLITNTYELYRPFLNEFEKMWKLYERNRLRV